VEKLFVYGTLREPKIQRRVIGHKIKGELCVLEGYKKIDIKIFADDFPIIIKKRNHFVEGILLNVNKKELGLIDLYESRIYKRKMVKTEKGRAWAYIPTKLSRN